MTYQPDDTHIIIFLEHAKKLILEGKYDFVPRRKNMQSLAQYGLTITNAKNEILDLVVRDYYKGPEQDHDITKPGEVWIFKKNIENNQFYIKLKIVEECGMDILKCISFHVDD